MNLNGNSCQISNNYGSVYLQNVHRKALFSLVLIKSAVIWINPVSNTKINNMYVVH